MSLLDIIKSIFNTNKKYAKLIVQNLSKTVGETDPLEIALYDNDNPLNDKKITIEINTAKYTRTTNEEGIAKLNINLPVGEYDVHVSFNDPDYIYVKTFCTVTVNPIVLTNDLSMSEKDGSKYTATITDNNGNRLSGKKVVFTINNVNYERTTNENGVASLSINLHEGNYQILTKCYDVVKENMIHIATPTPIQSSNPYGYWIFGKDMLKVNLQDLKNHGITDILLNYYAFTAHGNDKVKEWIQQANNLGLNVHIWMQCFYNGEWINPKTTDLTDKINEAKSYADISDVYGVHLDYLRYPGNAYKTEGATEAVNDFVKRVKDVIGGKFLSCAVMPESDDKYYYGQDIEALGQICDAVIPMQYKGNYKAGSSWLASTTKMFAGKATIWSGLQSYKSDDDTTVLSESELLNDINTCLTNGAKGAILFRYGLSPNIYFPTPTPSGKKQTRMEGIDINMTYQDGSKYQCAVYDDVGRVAGNVNLTINGKTYHRTPDNEGLYKLTINLEPGNYPIKAEYLGDDTHLASSVNNTIIVNEKPKPTGCTNPYESSPHPTSYGCNGMGQNNSTCCGPSALHKILYKFGIRDITQGTLSSWAGTTSAGTSHQGLETAIAKVNQEKGTNIRIDWYNLSELGWENIGKIICQHNKAALCHILYQDGGTCDGDGEYGHYELLTRVNTKTEYVQVLNSLGGYCGNCYCGYYQDRSIACQEHFISGISQKSIAVVTIN